MISAPANKRYLSAPVRHVRFPPSDVECSTRPDGSLVVRPLHPLGPYPDKLTERLDHWAADAPDRIFLAERDRNGAWRTATYAQMRASARKIAQALLDRPLSADRPIAILSGNDIEHAALGLGAMYAGIPFAPISPAYSLVSSDFGKLRMIFDISESAAGPAAARCRARDQRRSGRFARYAVLSARNHRCYGGR